MGKGSSSLLLLLLKAVTTLLLLLLLLLLKALTTLGQSHIVCLVNRNASPGNGTSAMIVKQIIHIRDHLKMARSLGRRIDIRIHSRHLLVGLATTTIGSKGCSQGLVSLIKWRRVVGHKTILGLS